MSDIEKMAKYAQASIGEHDYRWTVKGNGDGPGAVDLLVEAWVKDTRTWKETDNITCIPVEVFSWLAKHAKIVARIEDGGAS